MSEQLKRLTSTFRVENNEPSTSSDPIKKESITIPFPLSPTASTIKGIPKICFRCKEKVHYKSRCPHLKKEKIKK